MSSPPFWLKWIICLAVVMFIAGLCMIPGALPVIFGMFIVGAAAGMLAMLWEVWMI